MTEQWRPIPGYEGYYEVSDTGRVRASNRTGTYRGRWGLMVMNFPAREMRICTTPTGYQYVALKRPNEKSIKHLLHRLVMLAFAGEPPSDRPQVNHIDGVKANNHRPNLEYCSASENLLHLTKVLKRKIGGAGGYSKLTEAQARSVISDPRTLKEIAKDYGVSFQAIGYIKAGKNWSHLQEKGE